MSGHRGRTKGAFCFLLRLNTSRSSWDVGKDLIEDNGVITIPGEAFGATDPSLRISHGNPDGSIAMEGIGRLKRGLGAMQGEYGDNRQGELMI